MPSPCLTDLPTEILEAIFFDLDPRDLVSVSQTNKLIKNLTADSPIIWRHLCRTQFKTWDSRHRIAAKLTAPLSDVDWRALYIEKSKIGKRTKALLDHVVSTQHLRIKCINEIAEYGYDAKEALLREFTCSDDAEDVLARRYYANAVLERIHREIAINVWRDVQDTDNVPLEQALGAYDVFARVGEDVDMSVMEEGIDGLAKGVMEKFPDFHNLSPRMKAATLTLYLREQGFEGVSDRSYHELGNSFIGLVLSSTAHQSLPLISVAIYCALARRVGLNARPCGYPRHVYTLVYAPPNYNLDGQYKPTSSSALDYMFLDPFRSCDEIRRGDLERKLYEMGIPRTDHNYYLAPSSNRDMVLRAARNIMTSVQTMRQHRARIAGLQASWLDHRPDMDNAFYATIWAMLILGPTNESPNLSNPATRRRQYLPYLLEHFQTHFPWDITLLEHYVIPMFEDQPEGRRLQQFLHAMDQTDAMPKPVLSRDDKTVNVKFKVGQLFQHKRYSYEGVITGWDVSCDAGEEWIQNMDVDRLSSGRNQAFYHVL
jgi:F-box protein 21